MRSFQTLSLVLAASVAIACTSSNVTAHAIPTQQSTSISTKPQRHLRVQHGGVNDDHGEVASDAGIPGHRSTRRPGASSTTNVNVTPGTINTNVNITPGTSTTAVNGVATAPAPQAQPQPQAMAQPRPSTATATAPMGAPAKPNTSGLGFDSLNPLSMVATLAHQAHGMLLGHTGTLPSSYMQGQSGGHGH